MKHIFSQTGCLTLLFCMIMLSSCVKKVAGPKGETGAPGKTGNAKQTHISSFSLQSSQWTLNGQIWEAYIYDSRINSDILASGDVDVYLQTGRSWNCLPHSAGDIGDIITQYALVEGRIYLQNFKIHAGPPAIPLSTNYRVVIMSSVK